MMNDDDENDEKIKAYNNKKEIKCLLLFIFFVFEMNTFDVVCLFICEAILWEYIF